MKKLILSVLLLAVVASNVWGGCGLFDVAYDYDPNRPDDVWTRYKNVPLNAKVPDGHRNNFYVGETVVIPIESEGCKCLWLRESDDKRTICNCEISYTLAEGNISLEEKQKKFLSQDEIDDYYANVSNPEPDCHWRNRQSFWMELSGLAVNKGHYEGTLTVKRTDTKESKKVDFSFDVNDVPKDKKIAILSNDPAANYNEQMEIYSKIHFDETADKSLRKPYFDYYFTKNYQSRYVVFDIWNKPENTCIQVLDCGDGIHYVFRHRYRDNIQTSDESEFQLALFESDVPNTSNAKRLDEKIDNGIGFVDYSYKYFGDDVVSHANMRNSFYNDNMALFEGKGNFVYGSSPDWYLLYGANCKEIDPENLSRNFASAGVVYNGSVNSKNLCEPGEFDVNPITIEFDTDHDVIYEGEDYFALPTVTSTEGEIKSLEITYQDQFDWLETGTPNDYWLKNYVNSGYSTATSGFSKTFYIRSINHAVRQNHNLPVGTYTYTIKAKDDKNNEAMVTRTVVILDGSEHPSAKNGSNLAVLVGDETWFAKNQLDIASGIERYDDNVGWYPLKKGYHYDYFGKVNGSVQGFKSVFHNWYSDEGVSQTLYDCGEGRYKIKYEITCESRWSINFNESLLDVKTGIVYGSGSNMHKENDYSMAPFVKNGKVELYARKYNPNVPLYDDKGNLLWGNPPDWHDQCTDFVKILPYETTVPRCDDAGGSGGEVVVNPEKKLTVQFYDANPNESKQGHFNFRISNEGSSDVSVDGYEIRFYYGGEGVTNVSDISFNPHDRDIDYVTISEERCTDNQYVLKMKIKNGSIAQAGNTFPQYDNIRLFPQTRTWSDFNKSAMYSYEVFDKLTENPKIALFDAYGNQVYGYPPPMECNILNNNDYAYKFRFMTAQFQDDDPNVTTKKADFRFQVANYGPFTAPIGNYEMRFYFQSKGLFDASEVNFENLYVGSADVSKKWCGAGLYYLSMKLDANAVVAANGFYPSQQPIHVSAKMGNGGVDFSKNDFDSWLKNALQMKDNNQMALFDAYGSLIFGEPPFACANPIVIAPGSTIDKPRFKVEVNEKLREFKYIENGGVVSIPNGVNEVSLRIENISDIDETGPVFVDYYITHPDGQNPLFCYNEDKSCYPNPSSSSSSLSSSSNDNIEFSLRDIDVDLTENVSVIRYTVGNKHVYRFTLKNGLSNKNSKEIDFALRDNCIECVYRNEAMNFFTWNLYDDWSAKDWVAAGRQPKFVKTDRVVIRSKDGSVLYGWGDDGMPSFKVLKGEGDGPEIEIPGIVVQEQTPNRTDAIAYSGGQLLLNGDFEEPSLMGWTLERGDAISVRGSTIQGSRFMRLNGQISQSINEASLSLLLDSGAVLSFWHRSESCGDGVTVKKIKLTLPGALVGSAGPRPWPSIYSFDCSKEWIQNFVTLEKDRFIKSDGNVNDDLAITFETSTDVDFDDVTLVPGRNSQPSTYAVRLTTTQHEELETRAYDNERDSVIVTSSKRDAMGRTWYKYLPYKSKCTDAENCNADAKTLKYVDKATLYYNGHPDYANALGFPYAETQWKPDPAATKDVEGAPGKAFSLDEKSTIHHVSRAYSSGVNLSGIDKMNFNALASVVNAVRNCRVFADGECKPDGSSDDGVYNFHAAKDTDPTHMWELNVDPNGNAAFTIKDGEGHVIISGAMKQTTHKEVGKVAYELASRSVNELDARGNVVKTHSPLSCDYTPTSTNCVLPSEYEYDSQSRVIRSWEPDAGTTLTYYDFVGRICATQTQKQIGRKTASVMVYDYLDRVVVAGEWEHGYDESELKTLRDNLLLDENDANVNFAFPTEKDLAPGTITRTFYDKAPLGTDYGVELYPVGTNLEYTRGHIAAIISDVAVEKNENGTDKVIRVSTANSYDKYGRVVKTFSYGPIISTGADSLNLLAVETEYDLGGNILSTTKYPYGLTPNGRNRSVTETYVYDSHGRIDRIMTKNGNASLAEIARYYYFPTGAIRGIVLGNVISMFYLYHISGAVKRVEIKDAKGADLFSETLDYEDCGLPGCKPQYNGNISRMVHEMAFSDGSYSGSRDVQYVYDELNRLSKVKDSKQPMFDEMFEYDVQGRIVAQHRAKKTNGLYALDEHPIGGEYTYESGTNRLKSVAANMGGESADNRYMSDPNNFEYDSEGNLTEDKSKGLKISYDWRGMPIEFKQLQQPVGNSGSDLFRLTMSYDGSGRRISKTRWVKKFDAQDWEKQLVIHYTEIGTEIRESFTGPVVQTKVVVNMPQGLGRYGVEDAESPDMGFGAGYIPNVKFEWFLKNHLGSTMLVYGTQANASGGKIMDKLDPLAAYDYRAFGEQVNLVSNNNGVDKVTETFTGKEFDDEIALDYFGARYLDPMLGLWISVDPKRQFASPYLYAGNGVNPVNVVDSDGNEVSLSVDENRTITDMQYKDNGIDRATVAFADGSTMEFVEPPKGSYFWSKNDEKFEIIGKQFDCTMEAKANAMIEQVDAFAIGSWGSGGDYDFKYRYYSKFGNNSAQRDALTFTVGSLNGTIMTARDVGNALWGGYTRNTYLNKMYPLNPLAQLYAMNLISESYSLKSKGAIEDYSSLRMQNWGFRNYKP